MTTATIALAVVVSLSAAHNDLAFLLREDFADERLTGGTWDAQLNGARFNYLGGGYPAFSDARSMPSAPSLYSRQTFERKPGRCLAVVHCGNMHRGGADNASNPTFQFSNAIRPSDRLNAGPGWCSGQRQGFVRLINTVAPFGEGVVGPVQDNDNIDTLFLTVLGERGAFYLMCGEPAAAPTRVLEPRGTWVGLSIAAQGNTGCRWLDFTVRCFREAGQ